MIVKRLSFTTKHIQAKTLCIIDIGAYKIRTVAARFKNKKIEILGYSEKRQDSSYFSNQECHNLPGLSENIKESIEKLEKQIELPLDEIVLNYPFGELFFGSKKINYKRKNKNTVIEYEELEEIMHTAEKLCLKSLQGEIQKLYGLQTKEIQILISRVNSITLDGEIQKKILGKTGEQVRISILNGFIPKTKEQLLTHMGKVLKKKIFRILPIEYCLTKIFSQKKCVLINIGGSQTTVSIIFDGDVIGISKIPIGIQDLVQKITKNTSETQAEIIQKLHTDLYVSEKNDFLSVWSESLALTLQEILGKNICPHHFYLGGGGGKNIFIREYIEKYPFHNAGVHVNKKTTFIREDMSPIFKLLQHIRIDDIEHIPLDIYVLLVETNTLISEERDLISNSLREAVKKLGY